MIDLVQSVFDILRLFVLPDRPEWLLPLLGLKIGNWNVGRTVSNVGRAIGGAVNQAGRGITGVINQAGSGLQRAITPPGSTAARDAMNAAAQQQAKADAEMAKQIKALQDQIAAANKANADAEKARQAQEAEAKRQQMIREYDQSAMSQQRQSVTSAKDRLSRMNQMRTDSDATAMAGMKQTADSAGSKAMGIGGSTFDSLDYSRLGRFANSYDPIQQFQQRRNRSTSRQVMKEEEGNVNRFTLPDTTNLTFGGA
jgi:hypothetical protein